MPTNDDATILGHLARQALAAALREESLYAAIERGDFEGKVVTFKRYEDAMPDDTKIAPPLTGLDAPITDLDVATIRRVVQAIRDGEVHYQDGDWLVTINPMHLATPWLRGQLWRAIERLVELRGQVESP